MGPVALWPALSSASVSQAKTFEVEAAVRHLAGLCAGLPDALWHHAEAAQQGLAEAQGEDRSLILHLVRERRRPAERRRRRQPKRFSERLSRHRD